MQSKRNDVKHIYAIVTTQLQHFLDCLGEANIVIKACNKNENPINCDIWVMNIIRFSLMFHSCDHVIREVHFFSNVSPHVNFIKT